MGMSTDNITQTKKLMCDPEGPDIKESKTLFCLAGKGVGIIENDYFSLCNFLQFQRP